MDIKMEIKEEDPLLDDVATQNEIDDVVTQNEREFFTKAATIETNSSAVLLDSGCYMAIKTEVESETVLPDFCSQNEREFLQEDSVTRDKKYNIDHEVDNKIEIKVEPWWLETENSSVCDDIKDGDLPRIQSSRLFTEAVSNDSCGKSVLSLADLSGRDTFFFNGRDHSECQTQEGDVRKIPSVEKHVHSEESTKCSDREVHSKSSRSKQNSLIDKGKWSHKCNTCEKSFKYISDLKRHESIHGTERHICKVCGKNFTLLSNLKKHYLIHECKKPHHCKTCDKTFSQLSYLKKHNLIHEGIKPHQCKMCNKSFNDLSNLRKHKLIHEGKKQHQCKMCNKSFTQLSHLKTHNLIHEGKKPHQCNSCDKRFTRLSHLKRHNLVHQFQKVI